MQKPLKIFLRSFLWLWTLVILAYASLFVLFNSQALRDIHDTIPPLQYIGTFLGVYDNSHLFDDIYGTRQRISDNIERFISRKQQGDAVAGHRLALDDPRDEITLYSPVWTFAWQVSSGATQLEIIFAHQGRDESKIMNIALDRKEDVFTWSHEVSLGRETLFNGANDYILRVTFEDGRKITKRVELSISYDRVEVKGGVLYFDTSFVPDGEKEDILREAPDFDNDLANFVTYGCDPELNTPGILMQQAYQYKLLPACMTFSLEKDYLFWYDFQSLQDDTYLVRYRMTRDMSIVPWLSSFRICVGENVFQSRVPGSWDSTTKDPPSIWRWSLIWTSYTFLRSQKTAYDCRDYPYWWEPTRSKKRKRENVRVSLQRTKQLQITRISMTTLPISI